MSGTQIVVRGVTTHDDSGRYTRPAQNRIFTVADAPTRDYVEHAEAIPKVLQLGDVSLGDGKLIRDTLVEALQPLVTGRTPGRTLSAQDCKDLAIYTAKIWNGQTGTPVEVQRRATILLRDSIFDVAGQLSVGATTAVEFADLATGVFDAKLRAGAAATADTASNPQTTRGRIAALQAANVRDRQARAATPDASAFTQPRSAGKRMTIPEINEANRKYRAAKLTEQP